MTSWPRGPGPMSCTSDRPELPFEQEEPQTQRLTLFQIRNARNTLKAAGRPPGAKRPSTISQSRSVYSIAHCATNLNSLLRRQSSRFRLNKVTWTNLSFNPAHCHCERTLHRVSANSTEVTNRAEKFRAGGELEYSSNCSR